MFAPASALGRSSPLKMTCMQRSAALVFAALLSFLHGSAQTSDDASGDLYGAALHTLHLVRSGVAVDDAATGVHHPASHTHDALLAETGGTRDLTGGWYNAGDYGKWTAMAALTVSYLLDLYALQERAARTHPPSAGVAGIAGDPALLDQARWGLSWMLKMQDADGGVRNKVDGATQASLVAAWGKAPELDPNQRIAAPAATGSTADFVGVMYQAARFFDGRDHAAALRYRNAADAAWRWLQTHPAVPAHDPFYRDHDAAGELLWASAEHSLRSGKDTPALVAAIRHRTQREVSWLDPSLLGIYQLAYTQGAPRLLREAAREAVLQQAKVLADAASRRPYRVALDDHEFWWASAERDLHMAAMFLMADELQPSPLLQQAARDQLAWMLGNNAAHHSFVTGFGRHPVLHPWHWIYRDYGIAMPGWAVNGPNSDPEGADPALRAVQRSGAAPGASYVDRCDDQGSWASNEGEISEEAALVFVSGVLPLVPNTGTPVR